MNCPLCNEPMVRSSRTMSRTHVIGYTDRLYCSGKHCDCTVKLEVMDHEGLKNVAKGLAADGEEI